MHRRNNGPFAPTWSAAVRLCGGAILVACIAVGCDGRSVGDADTTTTNPTNPKPPATTDDRELDVVQVLFVLENQGSRTLYIDLTDGGHVALSRDGTLLDAWFSCGRCVCGEECEVVCGPPFRQTLALAPGDRHELGWNGTYFVHDAARGCDRQMPLAAGVLAASATYATAVKEHASGSSSLAGDLLTSVVELDHPPAEPVVIPLR